MMLEPEDLPESNFLLLCGFTGLKEPYVVLYEEVR
jgi:hypothetical protein